MPQADNLSTRGRLAALLERDGESGKLVAVRGGMISRTFYATLLGVTASGMAQYADVFEAFELKYLVATGPMRHFPQMKVWLEERYQERSLRYSKGKIDRKEFAKKFKLNGGIFMVRHAAIRELLESYDERAARENYMEATRQGEFDLLIEALKDPPLNKDRLTVNRKVLAERSGISFGRLKTPEFWRQINDWEKRRYAHAKDDDLDPYFSGRVFVFSDLEPLWGRRFLSRVAIRLKLGSSSRPSGSVKQMYLALHHSLDWIGSSDERHCQQVVGEALHAGKISGAQPWEEALYSYRAHLVSDTDFTTGKRTYVDHRIAQLRSALEWLVSGGAIPSLSVPLAGVKNSDQMTRHLRSVAELAPSQDQAHDREVQTFISERLKEANSLAETHMSSAETKDFLRSLHEQMRRGGLKANDISAAVLETLDARLGALRRSAASIVDKAMEDFDRGRELIATADIDADSFERNYFKTKLTLPQRSRLLSGLFPPLTGADGTYSERGFANLLSLINQRHGGVPPPGVCDQRGTDGQFFAKRYLQYGGLSLVHPYSAPEPAALGAVLTLYLVESGSNVSVGRTLDEQCRESSDHEGYTRITGQKARANGKPIIVDLPNDCPAARALGWLVVAGESLRKAGGDDADRLFVMRMGGDVQLMTPHWYTNWFKNFADSLPELRGLGMTPNMIRPSVLLRASLSNDGRLMTGIKIGQHGQGISQGYQQKFPTLLLYENNIRRFATAFETLVLESVEDAAHRLGITSQQFEERLKAIRPTGLGTFCKRSAPQPGQRLGNCAHLECWDDCPNLLLIAEVEPIAALQLWQSALRRTQGDWERDRPERWSAVWLPWLCLANVVEEKMSRGLLIKTWTEATMLAEKLKASPGYVDPAPW